MAANVPECERVLRPKLNPRCVEGVCLTIARYCGWRFLCVDIYDNIISSSTSRVEPHGRNQSGTSYSICTTIQFIVLMHLIYPECAVSWSIRRGMSLFCAWDYFNEEWNPHRKHDWIYPWVAYVRIRDVITMFVQGIVSSLLCLCCHLHAGGWLVCEVMDQSGCLFACKM